ncbi:MAG: hypothetical protein SGPRY_000925 [Prymnesium sp.]
MAMRRSLLCFSLAAAVIGFDFDDDEVSTNDASEVSCALEHSFNGKDFSSRGKLYFQNVASARAPPAKLSGDELETLKKLAREGGYYTLRIPSKLDDPNSLTVSASAPACALVASHFQERLHLTRSPSGHLLALSYILPVVPASCWGESMPRIPLDEVLLNTSVTVHSPVEGPVPHGRIHEAAFLPPAAAAAARAASSSADGKEDGDGQPQPPQSFLRKYWMYVLGP